jgi:hypothetical protein
VEILSLEAYGELAQAMALHVFEKAKAEDDYLRASKVELYDAPWPIYFHDFMSTFEAASACLHQLKILKGVAENSCFSVFNCEVDGADGIAKENWRSGPSFEFC